MELALLYTDLLITDYNHINLLVKLVIFIPDFINIVQNLSQIVADFQILLWSELGLALVIIELSYYGKSNLKGTVMQIEKTLVNDCLRVSKVS